MMGVILKAFLKEKSKWITFFRLFTNEAEKYRYW